MVSICCFPLASREQIVDFLAIDLSNGQFLGYTALLAISGLLMLGVAIAGLGAGIGSRVVSGLLGLAFLGYGIYLAFFFEGTEFRIIFYAFIVPIVVIANVIKSRKAAKQAA
jgi:hypothetical protein